MNPDAVTRAVAARLASQGAPLKAVQSEAGKGGGSKASKKREKLTEIIDDSTTPKKARAVDKGKRVVGETTVPFAFPMVDKELHENSIFNPSYDHPQLVDNLVGKEDNGLIWAAGPGSACRMAQFMGLQLAVVGRQLEKMWIQYGKERDEEVAKLKKKVAEEKDAVIARLTEEIQKKDAEVAGLKEEAKKKEEEFKQATQEMTDQAAAYLLTGFDMAKFQVGRVHLTVDLSMLNVLVEDEDFQWPVSQSDEEKDEEEGGGGN